MLSNSNSRSFSSSVKKPNGYYIDKFNHELIIDPEFEKID